MIVGERVRERVDGLELGDGSSSSSKRWKVVGVFARTGGAFESEIWGDFDVMAAAFKRGGGYQSLIVRLADPAGSPTLDADRGRARRCSCR